MSFALVSTAVAQEPITGTTVIVPGQAPPARIDTETLKDYKGTYLLSNGKTLSVIIRGKRVYAEMDKEPRIELMPSGKNSFVARDTDMMYMFDQTFEGKRTDVIIKPRSMKLGG
ncbi:MAG: hypothetical protein ACXWVD_09260 [Telluria sp.]